MITKIDGVDVIHLQGFDTGKEIIISDSDSINDYKKVDIVLAKDMLEFLITDRRILDNLNIDITVWGN